MNEPDWSQVRGIEDNAAKAVEQLLDALLILPDHNTKDTPKRVAKMLVREALAGRFEPPPDLAVFPNMHNVDEIYCVGPISFSSMCAHHLVPIIGKAWIGVLPDKSLMGLSKFHRLTRWVMARPQMQEEATEQLATALHEAIKPRGLAVVLRATHFCCSWRGVRDEPSLMTTSVNHGLLREDPAARAEFLALIAGMGF